jgi:hypothetical protein
MQNAAFINVHVTVPIPGGGSDVIHQQDFVVAGIPQQDFTIAGTFIPGTGQTEVFLNGVKQVLSIDYTELNPTTIRMAAPVPVGQRVCVVWNP